MITFIVGILLGFFGPVFYTTYRTLTEQKAELNKIKPKEAKDTDLCKGPHAWGSAAALTNEGIVQKQICKYCGLISGTNKVAPQETLERMEEREKLLEFEKKAYKEFLDREYGMISDKLNESLGKENLEFNDLLSYVHGLGMNFEIRYNLYKASKSQELEEETHKGNA